MARYIDADETLRMMQHSKEDKPSYADWDMAHNCCIDCVNTVPTADVVEVKHGKWEEERWCDNFQHICSLCHRTVRVHPQSVAYKYCPYCGAKMDEKGGVQE